MTSPLWEAFREGCRSCVFWNVIEGAAPDVRQCRRHPPVLMPIQGVDAWGKPATTVEQHQPWTYQFDWCGEFKREMPRDTTPAA